MLVRIHKVEQLFDDFFKIMDFFDSDFPEFGKRFLNDAIVQTFPFDFGQFILYQDELLVDLSHFSDVVVTRVLALEEAIDERFQR